MPGAPRRPTTRAAPLAAAALAALAVLALHLALAWIALRPEPRVPFGDETRYHDDALAIAAGADWRPDPIWPVLYPELLARVLPAAGGLGAVPALQTLLLAAAAWLWFDAGRRLTGSRLAAAVAACLLLVDPQVAGFAHYLWPEVLHLFLFAAAFAVALRARGRALPLVATGLLLGLAVLTKKLLWPFLPLFVWPAIVEPAEDGAPSRLRRAGLLAAGFTAALLPAVVAFGPYAVSPLSSATFNFWVGLNDTGRRSFEEPVVEGELERYASSGAEAAARDRATGAKIRQRFADTGTVEILLGQLRRQYVRLFDRESFFTEQLPGGDVHAGGGGYRRPPPGLVSALRGWSSTIYGATLAAAVFGALLLRAGGRAEARWLRMLAGFVLFNLAVFLFAHVKSRYRIAFLPVLDLWAGVAIAWGLERLGVVDSAGAAWRERLGAGRLAIGTVALAALAGCFFGGG